MKSFKLYFFLSFILFPFLSFSQQEEPINPDRPDQTESPEVIEPLVLQIESGFIYERTIDNTHHLETNTTFPQVLIRFGLIDAIEFRTYIQYISNYSLDAGGVGNEKIEATNNGFIPTKFGVKIKVSEGEGLKPSTAFLIKLSFPKFASRVFTANYIAPELIFSLEHNWTKKLTVGYNLGMVWDGDTPEQTNYYTASFNYSLSKRLNVFAETYGFYKRMTEADNRLDGGITFLVTNNIMVDAEGGIGLSNISPKYFIGAGFSFRTPKL